MLTLFASIQLQSSQFLDLVDTVSPIIAPFVVPSEGSKDHKIDTITNSIKTDSLFEPATGMYLTALTLSSNGSESCSAQGFSLYNQSVNFTAEHCMEDSSYSIGGQEIDCTSTHICLTSKGLDSYDQKGNTDIGVIFKVDSNPLTVLRPLLDIVKKREKSLNPNPSLVLFSKRSKLEDSGYGDAKLTNVGESLSISSYFNVYLNHRATPSWLTDLGGTSGSVNFNHNSISLTQSYLNCNTIGEGSNYIDNTFKYCNRSLIDSINLDSVIELYSQILQQNKALIEIKVKNSSFNTQEKLNILNFIVSNKGYLQRNSVISSQFLEELIRHIEQKHSNSE